jgi:hypothetical protein
MILATPYLVYMEDLSSPFLLWIIMELKNEERLTFKFTWN